MGKITHCRSNYKLEEKDLTYGDSSGHQYVRSTEALRSDDEDNASEQDEDAPDEAMENDVPVEDIPGNDTQNRHNLRPNREQHYSNRF